ncbi:short chain dehydrogenase [Acuticoccus sediminis]|uniref:Short chain dehydrogenase n=1 Tax=Acuticoccus sediminis TaxID=2184697 RepID=A0A8B2NVA9_9HYPH|nr:SDR family oxidoreductase [Acuticoccus sediminis]RAI03283.1 short chain dehydrogenase [Acuticoccus sediminis]
MADSQRLKGKTALVTGAASGFGRGIAERYVAEGARVAVLDINEEGAKAVASSLGNAATPLICDITDGAAVNGAVDAAISAFGEIDILVNNAGWSNRNTPVMDTDEETFDKLFAINVKSIFHFTKAILPHWRSIGRGVMINVGSTAGVRPRPGLVWYNATKATVNNITKSLAIELAPEKIRVCGIAPVMGETGLLETFMGVPDTPENRAKFIATIPLGRLSKPSDIAGAAVYLASDDAELVTGVNLEIDGGRCI